MLGSNRPLATMAFAAAILLPLVAIGDGSASNRLLPRAAVVPLSLVTKYFPDVTKETATTLNETTVGNATGSISVVFTDVDSAKKVTLSVDQYANAEDARAAFQTAIQASEAAPGFKPTNSPNLGQEAFAGSSQVGSEMHYGLGARDGGLIVSATHAGDIPVTPGNSESMIHLAGAVFEAAKKALGY